jgi:hypothetical protein
MHKLTSSQAHSKQQPLCYNAVVTDHDHAQKLLQKVFIQIMFIQRSQQILQTNLLTSSTTTKPTLLIRPFSIRLLINELAFSIVATKSDFRFRLTRGGNWPFEAAYSSTRKPKSAANTLSPRT